VISTDTSTTKQKSVNLKKIAQKENKAGIPSHSDQIANLNRIEGQIRGISKMIEEGRYCLDILNQCRSVHAALAGIEKKIFRRFLQTCVKDAFRRSTNGETEPMIDDIVELLDRK
jgi:DNA-binding FrmR family transcriptional regulator